MDRLRRFIRTLVAVWPTARRRIGAGAAALVLVSVAFSGVAHAQSGGPVVAAGSITNQAASNAACTGTSCVSIAGPLPSQGQCWIEVSGTFVETIIVEGSLTGAVWSQQNNILAYGASSSQSTITAAGLYSVPCPPSITVRASSYTSGLAQVQIFAVAVSGNGAVSGGGAVSGSVSINGLTSPNPFPVVCPSDGIGCYERITNSPAPFLYVVPSPTATFPVNCVAGCSTPVPVPTASPGGYPASQQILAGSAGNFYVQAAPDAISTPAITANVAYLVIPSPPPGEKNYIFYAGLRSSGTNTNPNIEWGLYTKTTTDCDTLVGYIFAPGIVSFNTLATGAFINQWSGGFVNGTTGIGIVPAVFPYVTPASEQVCANITGGTAWAANAIAVYAQH